MPPQGTAARPFQYQASHPDYRLQSLRQVLEPFVLRHGSNECQSPPSLNRTLTGLWAGADLSTTGARRGKL
jgi:hypothetical protein